MLRERAPGDDVRDLVTALAVERAATLGEDDSRYVEAVLRRVEELDVIRRIAELKGALQRMNPVEAEGYSQQARRAARAEQRRRQLREQSSGG